MADPFGSLAPAGLFGTLSPRQQQQARMAELLAGNLSMTPTQERDPAKLGPPTVQPGSFNWWADQALNFTPVGAGRDLAATARDIDALPPNPSWGELMPVIGSGILAAAGAVPGAGAVKGAAKVADTKTVMEAVKAALADMPVKIGGEEASALSPSRYLSIKRTDGRGWHLPKSARREFFRQWPKSAGVPELRDYTVRVSDHNAVSSPYAASISIRADRDDWQDRIAEVRAQLEYYLKHATE